MGMKTVPTATRPPMTQRGVTARARVISIAVSLTLSVVNARESFAGRYNEGMIDFLHVKYIFRVYFAVSFKCVAMAQTEFFLNRMHKEAAYDLRIGCHARSRCCLNAESA